MTIVIVNQDLQKTILEKNNPTFLSLYPDSCLAVSRLVQYSLGHTVI